jgi:hypothetical protein
VRSKAAPLQPSVLYKALYHFYVPLSPLRRSVPYTAFCLLYCSLPPYNILPLCGSLPPNRPLPHLRPLSPLRLSVTIQSSVSSTALCPLCNSLTLCLLYGPLFSAPLWSPPLPSVLLRPFVLSTALCPLSSPMSPQPSPVPSTALCPLSGPLPSLQASAPPQASTPQQPSTPLYLSTALYPRFGPLFPLRLQSPLRPSDPSTKHVFFPIFRKMGMLFRTFAKHFRRTDNFAKSRNERNVLSCFTKKKNAFRDTFHEIVSSKTLSRCCNSTWTTENR